MMNRDAQWLNRMYNNRALVPDFAAHFARWQSDSITARTNMPGALDMAYGVGPRESLDVFPAVSPPALAAAGVPRQRSAPVLVFIHGGYWRSLDKADHSFVATWFTGQGACVVVPNYALCPGDALSPVTVPHITMQMVKAMAWTYRNIARFGGDPARITVVGHSSGGHLAAMLLACVWRAYGADLPDRLVKNALSISGLYELQSIRQTPYLNESLRLSPAQVKKASPAWLPSTGVKAGRGVLYTVVGGNESAEFLRHNQLIQSAWGKATVPVCEALPGLNHFSVLEALVNPAHRLHQLALQLLRG